MKSYYYGKTFFIVQYTEIVPLQQDFLYIEVVSLWQDFPNNPILKSCYYYKTFLIIQYWSRAIMTRLSLLWSRSIMTRLWFRWSN